MLFRSVNIPSFQCRLNDIIGVKEKSTSKNLIEIDTEVRLIIDRNYARAKQLLADNIDILHSMADALMQYETLDAAQVDDLMDRKPVREPGDWTVSLGDKKNNNNKKDDTKGVKTTKEENTPKDLGDPLPSGDS